MPLPYLFQSKSGSQAISFCQPLEKVRSSSSRYDECAGKECIVHREGQLEKCQQKVKYQKQGQQQHRVYNFNATIVT